MKKPIAELVREPIFFERNRVYRIYRGGAPFRGIFADGYDDGSDNYFPEEWVASRVKAINPRYFGPRDGVSIVRGTDLFFDDLLAEYPEDLLGGKKYDCLVKFLDSAIRLPFQVHPTKEFAREHFGSPYGKTEAWLVIATRPGAKLYFGFRDKITKEELSRLEEKSETERDLMGGLLFGVDAHPGDLYLIRAGLIHAIGAGCTIIEVQEPTDFTIQPERWCGDYHISYGEEYIGLDKSTALDAIHYDIFGDAALAYARVTPRVIREEPGYTEEDLISYEDTPCFAEKRHTLSSGGSLVLTRAPGVFLCTAGEATVTGDGYEKKIRRGDYFFLPHAAKDRFRVRTDTRATLIECLPSKQD